MFRFQMRINSDRDAIRRERRNIGKYNNLSKENFRNSGSALLSVYYY
jgi:hypothetical protein